MTCPKCGEEVILEDFPIKYKGYIVMKKRCPKCLRLIKEVQ